jgi:hypothetical protein
MSIRIECAPVIKVVDEGKLGTTFYQDFTKPVELTIVDKNKGHVVCPLYNNGKCGTKDPCVINEVDMYTTVIGSTLSEEKQTEHIPHLPMSLYRHTSNKD